jgi:hypothetical protein
MPVPSATTTPTGPAGIVAMALTSLSVVPLIALQQPLADLPVLAVGLTLAWSVDRTLARSLVAVATGLLILSATSLEPDLSDLGMLRFALVLGGAVLLTATER